ncbi:hypothetical protein [Cellulomonas soli]
MSANTLVAGPASTSSALSGTGVVESVADLCSALDSGSWLSVGLTGVGAVLDVAATVIDPVGSLIAAGLGWLMEHLEPLKGWLDDLTGDAGAVQGFAATWDNVAGAMGAAGDELNRLVRVDLEAMSGEAVTAYAAYADALAERIRVTGASATSIGSALRTCATVVQVVHDLVRDTLARAGRVDHLLGHRGGIDPGAGNARDRRAGLHPGESAGDQGGSLRHGRADLREVAEEPARGDAGRVATTHANRIERGQPFDHDRCWPVDDHAAA